MDIHVFKRTPHLTLIFLAVVQGVLALVLVVGDIGFDHPGRFGLSFGHFIALAIAIALAAIAQMAIEVYTKMFALLLGHVLFLAVLGAWILSGAL